MSINPIVTILPQHDWMPGGELMAHFRRQERDHQLQQLSDLIECGQVLRRRIVEHGVSVPVFRKPEPVHGQIELF